jgi:hypothetical protein
MMAGKHFFTGKTEYTFAQIISTIAIFTVMCFYTFNYFSVDNSSYYQNSSEFYKKNTILNVVEYFYSVDFKRLEAFEGEKTLSQIMPEFDIEPADQIFVCIKDEKINLKKINIKYKDLNTDILLSEADI